MGSYEPSEFYSCQTPNCRNKLWKIRVYWENLKLFPHTILWIFPSPSKRRYWNASTNLPVVSSWCPAQCLAAQKGLKITFNTKSHRSLWFLLSLSSSKRERGLCSEQWDFHLKTKERENGQPHGLYTLCPGPPVFHSTVLGPGRCLSDFLTKRDWTFASGVVFRRLALYELDQQGIWREGKVWGHMGRHPLVQLSSVTFGFIRVHLIFNRLHTRYRVTLNRELNQP